MPIQDPLCIELSFHRHMFWFSLWCVRYNKRCYQQHRNRVYACVIFTRFIHLARPEYSKNRINSPFKKSWITFSDPGSCVLYHKEIIDFSNQAQNPSRFFPIGDIIIKSSEKRIFLMNSTAHAVYESDYPSEFSDQAVGRFVLLTLFCLFFSNFSSSLKFLWQFDLPIKDYLFLGYKFNVSCFTFSYRGRPSSKNILPDKYLYMRQPVKDIISKIYKKQFPKNQTISPMFLFSSSLRSVVGHPSYRQIIFTEQHCRINFLLFLYPFLNNLLFFLGCFFGSMQHYSFSLFLGLVI